MYCQDYSIYIQGSYVLPRIILFIYSDHMYCPGFFYFYTVACLKIILPTNFTYESCVYIYIYIYISSCRAISTDIPDSLLLGLQGYILYRH